MRPATARDPPPTRPTNDRKSLDSTIYGHVLSDPELSPDKIDQIFELGIATPTRKMFAITKNMSNARANKMI